MKNKSNIRKQIEKLCRHHREDKVFDNTEKALIEKIEQQIKCWKIINKEVLGK